MRLICRYIALCSLAEGSYSTYRKYGIVKRAYNLPKQSIQLLLATKDFKSSKACFPILNGCPSSPAFNLNSYQSSIKYFNLKLKSPESN